jgi:alkanesulfonate monooxygenase
LVGTPETVIQALLDYYDLGVTTFLNRGYEPLFDAVDYGRYIIPVVREEVRKREEAAANRDTKRLAGAALQSA